MRWRPRFSLSSLFLLALAVAIALGWYVDSRRRQSIVGTWVYPTPESGLMGFGSTLDIRADGTFTKSQYCDIGQSAFDGSYEFGADGRVLFHVTSGPSKSGFGDERVKLDAYYAMRCAADSAGYLLLQESGWQQTRDDKSGITWETEMYRKPATR